MSPYVITNYFNTTKYYFKNYYKKYKIHTCIYYITIKTYTIQLQYEKIVVKNAHVMRRNWKLYYNLYYSLFLSRSLGYHSYYYYISLTNFLNRFLLNEITVFAFLRTGFNWLYKDGP